MTGRPQRILTEDELDIIRRVPTLTLHKCLILGLVDPVPNPSPMSEEEGAWVREHVWPDHLQLIDRGYPWGFRRWSNCERGTCWNCLNHRCDLCVHLQQGGPSVDEGLDSVVNHRGYHIATLITRLPSEPACSWTCRCPCPKRSLPDTEAVDVPAPTGPLRPTRKPRGRPAPPAPSLPDALF